MATIGSENKFITCFIVKNDPFFRKWTTIHCQISDKLILLTYCKEISTYTFFVLSFRKFMNQVT